MASAEAQQQLAVVTLFAGPDDQACCVKVTAVDADSNRSNKTFRISASRPLRELQHAWGQLWGIPEGVIGFEKDDPKEPHEVHRLEESLLNLDQTPKELDFGAQASVQAVPLEMTWAEKAETPVEEGDAIMSASKIELAAKRAESPAKASPKAAGEKKARPARPRKLALKASVAVKKARPPSVLSRPALNAAGTKRKLGSAVKASLKSKKAAGKSEGEKAPRKSGAKEQGRPEEDDRIVFNQKNPKREGTLSHARYEKYKKAKTIKDMKRLGAENIDVCFDFKHGFFWRA